jgi:hypothetical protein
MAGDTSQTLSWPVASKPEYFPNGVDVLAIVCPPRDILAVALYSPTGALDRVYLRSPFPTQNVCPLPVEDLGKQP